MSISTFAGERGESCGVVGSTLTGLWSSNQRRLPSATSLLPRLSGYQAIGERRGDDQTLFVCSILGSASTTNIRPVYRPR